MIKHLKIKVFGSVQGVLFRHWSKVKAKELKLTGFVQNRPDGSVYLEAEGEEKDLKDFLAWCHQGPSFARVEKVEFEYMNQIKGYSDFKIKSVKGTSVR